MSRRASLTWAPTSMPEIRRQWCIAIEAVADHTFDEYDAEAPPGTPAHIAAMGKRIQRIKARLAQTAAVMKSEAQALRGAWLYWVSRDLVDVVTLIARGYPSRPVNRRL
jgi:hypothetical protein